MKAKLRVVTRIPPIDLDRLARMGSESLLPLYRRLFGRAAPSGNSELARRRIAWSLQSEREGGLPESARQHALAIAKEAGLRIHVRRGSAESALQHATVTGIVSDHDSRLPMPGSIVVKKGDRVKTGQALGRLGNSGSSDVPHLHFHMVESDSTIFADGVPYVLKSFTWSGVGESFDALMEGKGFTKSLGISPDRRRHEFPVNNAVVSFP